MYVVFQVIQSLLIPMFLVSYRQNTFLGFLKYNQYVLLERTYRSLHLNEKTHINKNCVKKNSTLWHLKEPKKLL